ncbi:MAG: ComEC/Rec2 family competence protein [Rickettsiales bacterium]
MRYISESAYVTRRMCFRAWAMTLGAASYFSLPAEPDALPVFCVLLICLAVFACVWKREGLREYVWLPLFFVVGFASGKAETLRVSHPLLERETEIAPLYATLDKIDPREGGAKLYLSRVRIGELSAPPLPYGVRLSVRASQVKDALPGDVVYISAAALRPLPAPVVSGGYDFSFFAYYDGVGAVGYALSGIYRISREKERSLSGYVDGLRLAVAERFRERMAPEEAAVATALVVGMAGGISEELQNVFRYVGIWHLMAISGSHVAMAAGLAFFLIRTLLSYNFRFASAYDARVPAALGAIVAAGAYVLLAGAPVSAQRAFIMASILLVGVASGRRATPMHNVGLAAVGLLGWQPHMALHPGFQMSFFAVLAILSHVDMLRRKDEGEETDKPSALKRGVAYLGGVLLASFAAGVATMPFSAYHFNQFSWLGLPANMVAVPLTGAVVMPATLAAAIAMPFGLELPFCKAAEWAIGALIASAKLFARVPAGTLPVVAPDGRTLLLLLSGMVLCYLGTGRKKCWGLAPVAAALYMYRSVSLPDVIVSENGKVFAVRFQGGDALYVSDMRRDRYAREKWRERLALARAVPLYKNLPPGAECDKEGCALRLRGKKVVLSASERYARAHCDKTGNNVVVALSLQSENAWMECGVAPALVFSDFSARGNMALFLSGDLVMRGAKDASAFRPWRKSMDAPPLRSYSRGNAAE